MPATSALCLCVVSLLMAAWILGLTQLPGWRGLRWFVGIAASAAGYGLGTLVFTLPVSGTLIVVGSKVALMSGLLFGCCWIAFSAHLDARPMDRIDRLAIYSALACCALAPIPYVLFTEQVSSFVSGVGGEDLYRVGRTSRLGEVAVGLQTLSNLWVGFQLLRGARHSRRGQLPHALALLALIPLALADLSIAHGQLKGPSLLTFGLLLSVATVGVQISRRVAADTRALESVSVRLGLAQQELVAKERLAAVGEATAVVSHEVRNPLGVLFNVFNRLRITLPPHSVARAELEAAAQSSEEIDRVVSALLDSAASRDPASPSSARSSGIP